MDVPPQIGRFRVLDLVGEGAMGVVFRGRDDALDRDVALKLMRARAADAEARGRFLREARAVARLQHPNIVTLYELGEHLGSPFIAMELLEGVDLQRAIEAGLRPNPRATLPIVLQLLAGLGHAHLSGIVHRDVKPSNLFLPRGRPAKIMDFGVARLGEAGHTTGLMVGTPNYMSPEQVQSRPVDGRSDLFSAGLILYELVTGERAYRGDSIVTLVYQIAHEDPDLGLIPRAPPWARLREVLARALAKDPDQRYASAEEMAAELALALQDLGGSIDGEAASDEGLMVRTARPRTGTSPPAASASADVAPPPAASAPPPTAERTRRTWQGPAVTALVVLLAAGALALLGVAVVRSRPDDREHAGSAVPVASPEASLAPPAPSAAPATTPRSASPPRPFSAAPSPRASSGGEATASGPPPALARLDHARAAYARGRYADALAEARSVLAREPASSEARSLVEDVEAEMVVQSRLDQAHEALRRGDREAALEQVRAGLAVKGTDARLLSLFKQLTQ